MTRLSSAVAEEEKVVSVQLIKREFLKQKIVPWNESYLYHGTPMQGLACILEEGLACVGSHDLDYCLLSTSANERVLSLFSDGQRATGIVFNPELKRVLILEDFWYYALYGMSQSGASDMWNDYIAEHPEAEKRARKMGLIDDSGGWTEDDYAELPWSASRFLDQFLPRDVEAIMFPGFRDAGDNTEAEMAITERGMKVLEKAIEYIYVEGREFYDADAAKKYLAERGIKCGTGDNPPGGDYVYTDIGHKTPSVLWVWRGGSLDTFKQTEADRRNHGDLWKNLERRWYGRYDKELGLISVVAPQGKSFFSLPSDLEDALAYEFGGSTETIQFNPRAEGRNPEPATFWGRAGAGVLFHCVTDDTYLLTLRSSEVEQPGTWGIPGGACGGDGFYSDADGRAVPTNVARQCALRETEEELGYVPRRFSERKYIVYQKGSFAYTTFVLDVTETQKRAMNEKMHLNWENDRVDWFALDDIQRLGDDLHFGMQYALRFLRTPS